MRRPERLPKAVADWLGAVESDALYLSVATLLELEIGIRRLERRDPRQGAMIRRWKSELVTPTFRGRVLPFDESVADCCAAMQVPDRRPLLNSIVAATAIVHKLTLVTRNVADFLGMPVAIVNPWSSS